MWSLRSLRLRRGIFCRTRSSRQPLCSTPLRWSLPDLRLGICLCLSHILKPRPRLLNLDGRDLLAHRAVEVLLGSILDLRLRSVHLPLLDSNLGRKVMLASTRSLPEPLRSEGVFGSRSLVPHRRLAAA